MKQIQKGFTLIELMIVVAIIGILAVIAIPAYQDFTTRSQVSEMLLTAAACKNNVAEYFQDRGELPADSDAAGCSNADSKLAKAPSVTNGVITVQANGPLSVKLGSNNELHMRPTTSAGTIVNNGDTIFGWDCSSHAGTTILNKFLPAQCRS